MMSKRALMGLGVAAVLLVTLIACVFATHWDADEGGLMDDEMHHINYGNHDSATNTSQAIIDDDGKLKVDSLNYAVFEMYGPVLIVLAILMFGAMVGGICVAREEDETDDTD